MYLVKPVEAPRLAETAVRPQERLRAAQPALDSETLLQQLAARLQRGEAPAPLRWLRAQAWQKLRLIAVDAIDYLRPDAKYTLVAWRGDGGRTAEALVRLSLREPIAHFDPEQFAQVHRSVAVNLARHQPHHPR